jgi:hypothetical protein
MNNMLGHVPLDIWLPDEWGARNKLRVFRVFRGEVEWSCVDLWAPHPNDNGIFGKRAP